MPALLSTPALQNRDGQCRIRGSCSCPPCLNALGALQQGLSYPSRQASECLVMSAAQLYPAMLHGKLMSEFRRECLARCPGLGRLQDLSGLMHVTYTIFNTTHHLLLIT